MALPSVAALTSCMNNVSTVAAPKVKQERHDEAEIRELAAKMVEANKAKIATSAARLNNQNTIAPVNNNQPGILGFLTRTGNANAQGTPAGVKIATEKDKSGTTDADTKPPCDEESSRGKFGWVTLGKTYIPYVLRYGEKYCAVRMVELKLLTKYLSYLHADIYNCTSIRSYYITDQEARLLNEINVRHCESQFGRELFTTKDLVVRLQDAGEFYNFLDVCYNKLIQCSNSPQDKCGFIRINGESVVPYTVRDNTKYVPLFYFEGETDNLKLKAEKLEGWDLAYLKFCCKVQGIRNELFAHETCSVISVGDIRSYFPPGTVFEDYWPNKVVDSQLLLSGKNNSTPMTAGMWTSKPPAPPATASPTVHQVSTASKAPPQATSVQQVPDRWSGLVGGQPFQPGQLVRMAHPPAALQHHINSNNNSSTNNQMNTSSRSAYGTSQPRSRAPTGYSQYGAHVTMALASAPQSHVASTHPPPLVRSAAGVPMSYPSYGNEDDWSGSSYSAAPGLSMPSISPNSMHHMGMPTAPQHHQMMPPHHATHYAAQQRHTPPTISNINNNKYPQAPPPPLISVNGTNGGRYNYAPNMPSSDVIDLSSLQPQPQPAHNGRSNGNESGKLIQIVETSGSSVHKAYQVSKALVDNTMVPCINYKPFIFAELLMTLTDLIRHFFPAVPLSICMQNLQEVLRINLYQGNRQQMVMLLEAGKCSSVTEIVPLIQVRDVIKFMPQMKYMFKQAMVDASPPSKRSRTS